MVSTGSFRPIAAIALCLFALFFHIPASRAGDVDIVCIYPPPNSQFSESSIPILGYIVGEPKSALKVRLVNINDASLPKTESLSLFKGKIFSGKIDLEPGQSNLVVGDAVIPLFYDPNAENAPPKDFRPPRAHSGKIDSCNPCHGFSKGSLTLKSAVPELCLSCHEIGTESLRSATKKNRHTKEITPNCLRCHDPHVSFKKNLIKSAEPCLVCHETYKTPSLHDNIGDSPCASCHDPHASAYDKMMRSETEGLCLSCHKEVSNPKKYPASMHSPVSAGKCSGCHSTHAGEFPSLLISEANELCSRCHSDLNSKMFKGKKKCLDCHQAHSSSVDKRLLNAGVWNVCAECHKESIGVPGSHTKTERLCGNCHDPHSKGGFASLDKACRQCHNFNDEDFKWSHGQAPMTKVNDCARCHKLHNSKYPKFLAGNVHFPVERGGCSACHTMEGKELGLRYVGSKNCMRCHGDVTGSSVVVDTKRVHLPVYQRDCIACHNPHVGEKKLLNEEPEKLCGGCHGLFLRGVKNVHGVFTQGGTCPTCHKPHISDYEPLLQKPQTELCSDCHKNVLPTDSEELKLMHGALTKGLCTGCHNPHGTNTEKLLKEERDGLCRKCHLKLITDENGKQLDYLHGPVGAGNCTACHDLGHRHGKQDDLFLVVKKKKVCPLCHDVSMEHVPQNYASKMREVGNDCLKCHNPHGANNPKMIHAEMLN